MKRPRRKDYQSAFVKAGARAIVRAGNEIRYNATFGIVGPWCCWPRFRIGDLVRPRYEWRNLAKDFPEIVPRGRVQEIVAMGRDDQVLYIAGDHRAFSAYVFERPPPRRKRQR